MSRADADWRRCVDWLVRCGVVGKDHRVLGGGATVQDLVHLLKDGVLLCNLLNRLQPRAVNSKDFSQRPQTSQFVSTLNIKVFLQSCKEAFDIKAADLFEPSELFSSTNFSKVIHTLSVLSHTSAAKNLNISGFVTTEKPLIYSALRDQDDGASGAESQVSYNDDDDDPTYQNDSFDDKNERIYDDLCSTRRFYSAQPSPVKTPKRVLCINELVATESNYVEQALQMICTGFMKPLKLDLLPADFEVIFRHIQELLETHMEFLANLKKVESSDTSSGYTIPDCFIVFKERFLIYGPFCSNLTQAQETLDRLMLIPVHREQIFKCQIDANEGRFKLRDLLSVPMQRVLKYHLLLQELVRHTDETHAERRSLERALEEMRDLSLFVNEVKRDNESLNDINLLQKTINDLEMPADTNLSDYGRMLLDGELKVKAEGRGQSIRHVFLFDQVLLMCKSSKGERFCYKESILLKQFIFEELSSKSERGSCVFSLTNQETRQVYQFTTKRELRTKWIEAIKLAQDNVTPKFARNEKHEFVMASFDKPTICDVCRKLLRGIFFQGYKCKKTHMAVHKECLERAKDMSGPPSLPPRPCSQLSPKYNKGRVQAVNAYYGDPPPNGKYPPLTFEANDVIELVNEDGNWWEGELDGKIGFFPASCVKKISPLTLRNQASYEPVTGRSLEVRSSRFDRPRSMDVVAPRDVEYVNFDDSPQSHSKKHRITSAPLQNSLSWHPWFGGIMSRDEATAKLQPLPNDTYVVRISVNDSRMGDYSLSIKYDGAVKHMRILKDPSTDSVFLGSSKMFLSVPELVQHYQSMSLETIFPEVQTVLRIPFKEACTAPSKTGEPVIVGYCRAQFDFSARAPNELSMKSGDRIAIINKLGDGKGWWKGRNNGKVGYFPNTYVEVE